MTRAGAYLRAAGLTAALAVSACAEAERAADNVARKSAGAAVDEVLVTRFPGVDGSRVRPFTDCVINNASAREIGRLAHAALVGVDDSTVSLVLDIARRPDAAKCFVQAGLASGSLI